MGNREQMEQRLRERLAVMLKTQLGLSDDQMRRLSEVNQRMDVQRRELLRREFDTRRGLREEILRKEAADQARVDQLLAEQLRIQRERIDLTEVEQRELGKFLTAVQRAQYLGLQEQLRREVDQARGRGGFPGGRGLPDSGLPRRRPPPA